MESKTKMGAMIMLFVTIIIGVVLLMIVADNTATVKLTNSVVNETVTVNLGAPTTFAFGSSKGLVSAGAVYNESSDDLITASEYVISLSAATITPDAASTEIINNTDLLVNYIYYADTYVEDSTSRALINLITILFVIGILGMSIYLLINKMMGDIL